MISTAFGSFDLASDFSSRFCFRLSQRGTIIIGSLFSGCLYQLFRLLLSLVENLPGIRLCLSPDRNGLFFAFRDPFHAFD